MRCIDSDEGRSVPGPSLDSLMNPFFMTVSGRELLSVTSGCPGGGTARNIMIIITRGGQHRRGRQRQFMRAGGLLRVRRHTTRLRARAEILKGTGRG
jgi:hypothetical protein